MKVVLFILALFSINSLVAQKWRDSLEVARSAYKKGDYPKALRYYESAQKQAPEGVDFSDEMGQSAYKAREFERAEKIYRQSAASKKTKSDKAKAYHNLGNARMKTKDYQGAVESYKESLRNNPNNEKTRYNLSEAIRRLKEEQKKQEQEENKNQDQSEDKKQNKEQNEGSNQDQQNKGNQDKNQSGQNGEKKKNNQNNSGQKKSNEKGGKGGQGNSGKLPNKSVERMLDELMKSEAATKRKIGGNRGESGENTSGKDW